MFARKASVSSSDPIQSKPLNRHRESRLESLELKAQRRHIDWKRALRKFERFRMTYGHTVESLFHLLNHRGTTALPLKHFAESLSQCCGDISFTEALALGCICDSERRMEIAAKDIRNLLSKQTDLLSLRTLLDDHPIFPQWLVARGGHQNLKATLTNDFDKTG